MMMFNGAGGKKIHQDLLADVQTIESTFAFYYNLTRVRWEAATYIVIPETDLEKANVEFNTVEVTPGWPDPTTDIGTDGFEDLIARADQCRDLSTVLAFYREGLTDMRALRYITAFYSFYFVLEGLYGNGKTKNPAVEAEFKRSIVLRAAIDQCIQRGLPQARLGTIKTIENLTEGIGKKPDADGIIRMLVSIRGDLHHFVNRKSRPSGSPFTHERYEVLAIFMRKMTHLVLHEEINSILPDPVAPES